MNTTYLKLTLAALFWGGAFIAGRHLALQLPHFVAATGRFVFASVVLVAYTTRALPGWWRLTRRQLGATLALGATGVFAYNYFFFGGLAHVPAGRASLIIATNPIVTFLVMAALYGQRMRPVQVAGVALSLAGVALVVSRGQWGAALSAAVGIGEALIFAAVLSWVAYAVIARLALGGLSPLVATTWSALWGTLMLAVPGLWQWTAQAQAAPDTLSWLAMLYLGVLGTAVAFVWYFEGIARIGPARTAVFTNLVPVSAVALSMLLLGEQPPLSSLVGGLMVIAGVTLTNRAAPGTAQ